MIGYDLYKNATLNVANNSTVPRRNLTTMGNQALGQTTTLTPQVDSSLQALTALLSRRGTDQDRAGLINRRRGNLDSNYVNARSRIESGFGGRLPNSMEVGALSNLEAGHAGNLSTLYNEADDTLRDREVGNADALLQVLTGARGNARNEYLQDTGLAQGIDQQNLSNYGNLNQAEEQRRARQQAEQQAWIQSIAGIAGMAGGWFGGGGTPGSPGGFSSPADASRSADLALQNNQRIASGAAGARNARWGY